MKRTIMAAIAALVTALIPFGAANAAGYSTAAEAVNSFGVSIYKNLAEKGENLFLSPYSISSALSMTYAGARGRTASEMERVLSLSPKIHGSMSALAGSINSTPSEYAELKTANAIWPASGSRIRSKFTNIVRRGYKAEVRSLDYRHRTGEARLAINNWVAEKTNGKIKDIIADGALDRSTEMVLTNAIYFKSAWQKQFSAGATASEDFYTSDGAPVKAQMMHNSRIKDVPYVQSCGVQFAGLPYKGGMLSMYIALPETKNGLAEFEKKLTPQLLQNLIKSARPTDLRVTLPKFKLEQTFSLSSVLKKMGMPTAFAAPIHAAKNEADFSAINGRRSLYIDEVIHKTFIDNDEKGTEAAAATAVVMMRTTSIAPETPVVTFKADHPFLFLIRDNKTGAILFIGKFEKPETR